MDYSDYSYSATTQAAFYKAEAKLLRLDDRLVHSPFAKYLKETLLAIDAVFALRISHEVVLPIVALITAFDLLEWRYHGDTERAIHATYSKFQFPENSQDAAREALHYMQTMSWVSRSTRSDTVVTIETVLRLHEGLTNGMGDDNLFHGFRRSFLPYKKGFDQDSIPSAVNDLCNFINSESFSPLGQASVIHHAFERIVPFDSMIDRTGLALSFLAMFKRDLFTDGFILPICWGGSLNREQRRHLRDSSRDRESMADYLKSRESWGVLNARNTYFSGIITDSFLNAAGQLRSQWRAGDLHFPANSALDKVLDLILGLPGLSARRAADLIGKSYGATNEALGQLCQAGILQEIALDSRERVFYCDQSARMITEFVNKLIRIAQKAETCSVRQEDLAWTMDERDLTFNQH